jgi:hypothetical protein
MSDQYKVYLEKKALLKIKHAKISKELEQCEKEIEELRVSYSKSCDHPAKISRFPVCAVCYKVPEVLPVAPFLPERELFETDVSFDRAIELVQRIGIDLYQNVWQCTYGSDSTGIFELQFTRHQPASPNDCVVFARPHGLPSVLTRDGGRFWYDADCGHRDEWKRRQYGINGPIVERSL